MTRLLDRSEVMQGDRLRTLLRLALGERPDGRMYTSSVARELGVSPSTLRRWVRDGVPEARWQDVDALVRPSPRVLQQEQIDLRRFVHERDAFADVDVKALPEWVHRGWEQPHRLSLVKIARLHVVVPRMTAHPPTPPARRRQLEGVRAQDWYSQAIRSEWLFPSRYHAAAARLELLAGLSAWRVQLRAGLLDRGATQAWLDEAPTPRRTWMAPYRVGSKSRARASDLRSRRSVEAATATASH